MPSALLRRLLIALALLLAVAACASHAPAANANGPRRWPA